MPCSTLTTRYFGTCSQTSSDRASAADPVQEAGGRRGGAEWAVQLRLPVFLLATRVAEGRRVLDVMAVSTSRQNGDQYDQVETLSTSKNTTEL